MLKMLSLLVICLAVAVNAHVFDRGYDNHHAWKRLNFINSVIPKKGQMDIRVANNGLLSMEMVVPSLKEQGIFYREITNGKTFIQVVYQNRDVIVDCDMTRNPDTVDDFIRKFFKLTPSEDWREMYLEDVTDRLEHGSNATFTELGKHDVLPEEFRDMVNFDMMKYECKELHREMRDHLKANKLSEFDDGDFTEDKNVKHSRSKRSMFIYPGTNWCGKGSTASNYYDLGENIDTDKCCRAHDYCSVTIEGLSSNYNYFNYRLHTLSHCECDDQ